MDSEAVPNRLVYVFDVAMGPDRPTAVTFDLQPDKLGPLKGRVDLDGGTSLTFSQFVYP